MDTLPKVLLSTLDNLCNEQMLLSWNINGGGQCVTVSIRFAESGYTGNTGGSTYGTPMKYKSPGSLRRDSMRYSAYKSKQHSPKVNMEQSLESNILQEENNVQACDVRSGGSDQSCSAMLDQVNEQMGHVSNISKEEGILSTDLSHDNNSVTKTKTHGPDLRYGQNQSQSTEFDDEPALILPEGLNGPVNPCAYFAKIVVDHRNAVRHPKLIGLTYDGEKACLEITKTDLEFYMVSKTYDPFIYASDSYWINKFPDQRDMNAWKAEITWLCQFWELHLMQEEPGG